MQTENGLPPEGLEPRGALCVECMGDVSPAEQVLDRTRASEIKEQLKRAASARPRVSNAVVLRADEAGVRCSYTSKATYDAEKLAAAEALLGTQGFAALFERKVTFNAVKQRLEEFLASDDEATAAARAAVRAAENRTEVATLTVVAQRKKKSS